MSPKRLPIARFQERFAVEGRRPIADHVADSQAMLVAK
jgi:hypothetical protein